MLFRKHNATNLVSHVLYLFMFWDPKATLMAWDNTHGEKGIQIK